MLKHYLIDATTGLAMWCGDVVPVLSETFAQCGGDVFLCYSINNAYVFEADAVDNFAQRKFRLLGQNLIVDPAWIEPVLDVNILAELKRTLALAIDDRVAIVIEKWTRFKDGYAERETAARAFKAAGYNGDVNEWISDFATPAGLNPAAAADRIIFQADTLKAALKQLEKLRMQKYNILRSDDENFIRAERQRIMSEIDVIVGGLT